MKDIALRLDRAAGAAIPYPPREVMARLTAVYEETARQAGFTSVADAMRARHAKHGRNSGDVTPG